MAFPYRTKQACADFVESTTRKRETCVSKQRIVAVGLLTDNDLQRLGSTFNRAFPVEKLNDFDDLLKAIDQAELRLKEQETPPR